jgi:glyoxalase superfamily protein
MLAFVKSVTFEGDLRAEVDCLRSLGATTVHQDEDSAVMQDPEGNEFCVVL